MWLLLAAHATAAPSVHPCATDDRLDEVVARAGLEAGPVVVGIEDGCVTTDIDHLRFEPGAGGVTDWTLRGATLVDVPPLQVSGGVTLTLESVRIATTSELLDLPAIAGTAFDGARPGIALLVHEATLHVENVKLVGAEGVGLFLVDGTVDGTGLVAEGFDSWRALIVVADAARTTLSLAGAYFGDNAAGATVFWGAGEDVEAHFVDGPVFERNGPAGGADLGAIDVADLTVESGRFTGSEGVADTTLLGAPISLESGSFTCTACVFTGTAGETATVADVALDPGDTFAWTGGEAAPASAVPPVLRIDRAGAATITDVSFTGAGQLYRGGGTLALTRVAFDGEGGAPDRQALKVYAVDTRIDGLRMCDYADNGWGLVAVYGGAFALRKGRFQALALGGNAVVKEWQGLGAELTLEDNTLVGSDAVFVAGAPAALTFVNNLVADTTGGVAVDAIPTGAVIDYNLWSSVAGLGTATGPHDVFPADAGLDPTFDPTDCSLEPDLAPGSPADAAGDPSRADDYGNARSDIGARDYDADADADTDTDTDTDTDADTATDTASPDTDAPDTGAPLGLVGGALPPCGCATPGVGASWIGVALALLARRRR